MQGHAQAGARSLRALLLVGATVCLPVGAACSDIAAADAAPPDRVTLVNRTNTPVVYYVLTPEAAARGVFATTGRVTKPPLGPGLEVTLTADSIIGEYRPGGDLAFTLSEVVGDSMFLRDQFALTGAELDRIKYRLEITQLPLRPASTPPGR